MESMAILNTTALDFVKDYNGVDIWKKRLCSGGWFMFMKLSFWKIMIVFCIQTIHFLRFKKFRRLEMALLS